MSAEEQSRVDRAARTQLRAVSDADAEQARLQLIAAAAIDLLDCIDKRTAAGWHKVPRREVETLRAAVNGEIL